jgi:hypothetical protein
MLTYRTRKQSANAAVDWAVRLALAAIDDRHPSTRVAFERLLRHARRSGLLRAAPSGGRSGTKGCGEIVGGLLALASHGRDWVREVEAWKPAGGSSVSWFSSLTRHLLAAYPVPTFMSQVWLKGHDAEARRQQGWFTHVGLGRNIRKADLPLAYTKMMAHHFLQAPDHFTVEEALRWGQVRGLGGSRELALAVAATRLGGSFESEDFWITVVHFLVNEKELDPAQVALVVDYVHNQRFVPNEEFVDDEDATNLQPPRPNLSMKGRTLRSLLRQVAEWHDRSKRTRTFHSPRWKPSGIGGFRYVERPDSAGLRCWTIRELTCAEELRREGDAMRHCVASYAGACARGETSIWSMTFKNDERQFRVMTIEVNPADRTIRQARRRGNASPSAKVVAVMKPWAAQEGLKLAF